MIIENLSIRLAIRFWGRPKVRYLGHRVTLAGLEAHRKDLEPLLNIPLPQSLREMQSFVRRPKLLQPLHQIFLNLRFGVIRVAGSGFLSDPPPD